MSVFYGKGPGDVWGYWNTDTGTFTPGAPVPVTTVPVSIPTPQPPYASWMGGPPDASGLWVYDGSAKQPDGSWWIAWTDTVHQITTYTISHEPGTADGGGVSGPVALPPPTGLDSLIAYLQAAFGARDEILQQLSNSVSGLAGSVSGALNTVRDQIIANLGKYLGPVGDILNKFQAQVGALVQGLVPTTLSLVGAALGGIESIAAAFLNNAASIDDILAAVAAMLSGKQVDIGAFVVGAVGGALESGLQAAVDGFTKDHPEIAANTLDIALTVPGLSPQMRQLITTGKDREHSPGAAAGLGILLAALVGMASAMAEPDIENARLFAWNANPTRSLGASDVGALQARGFLNDKDAAQLMRLDGMRPELHSLIYKMNLRFPDVEALFSGYFRGVIGEDSLDYNLRALGFDGDSIHMLKAVTQNIPNVSDVLRFLVRDVFIPEFVEAFGMDKEYPPLADEWAKKLGIPHDVMVLHWRAHWELPSVSQGYEMFQRDKIDETALRRLLRAQGVEPYWRDPLIAVSYVPLTRVDLRRMDKIGTITDAQLLRGYRDIGYSPEQAQLLFDFTKSYNKGDKPKTLTDLTDGLKARVVTAVINATITEDEGRDQLVKIGYKPEEIAAFLTEARLLRQEAISRKVADLIGKLYVDGHRTRDEAATALSEHGYIAAERDLILREWDLEKELKAPSAKHLNERDLTSSNIITAFGEGAMTEKEARDYLIYLRYDAHEADVLIAGAKYKKDATDEKESIDAVHVGVLSGRITEADASSQLSAMNVPAKKRDSLLAKWELERHGKVEKIPLSSLKDIFAGKLWDDAKMTAYLRATGYSDDDIQVLLILWGSQAAAKAARDMAAAANAAAKAAKKGGAA